MSSGPWFLYALRCTDDSVYTGVTTDITRRLNEHNSGEGARYTSGRRPVHLIGAWSFEDRSTAQRAEAQFRELSRRQKLQHVARKLPVAGSSFCKRPPVDALLIPTRFCPSCGELLKAVPGLEDGRQRTACTVCGGTVYQNAKPCAGVLVGHEGRLLLVKRAKEPYLGYWDIPGGFLEIDELPGEAAVREVAEETGLEVELTELLGFYLGDYSYGDTVARSLNVYFLGRVLGGDEHPGDEVTDLSWFAPDELPKAIAFEHAQEVLHDWTRWMSRQQRGSGAAGYQFYDAA